MGLTPLFHRQFPRRGGNCEPLRERLSGEKNPLCFGGFGTDGRGLWDCRNSDARNSPFWNGVRRAGLRGLGRCFFRTNCRGVGNRFRAGNRGMICPCQTALGALELARVALRLGWASDALTMARRDRCRECDQATRNPADRYRPTGGLTTLSRCLVCGCFVVPKTRRLASRCDLDRWPLNGR